MNLFQSTDEYGQSKVVKQLQQIFSACTLTIDQHYDDNNVVDIFFTATTSNGTQYKYAAECKDRYYNHTYSDDWFIEVKKFNNLLKASENGYKPLYINTYKDNWINIWDISKCEVVAENRYLKKTTVTNNGKVNKAIYKLNSADVVYGSHLIFS